MLLHYCQFQPLYLCIENQNLIITADKENYPYKKLINRADNWSIVYKIYYQ